VGVQGVRTPALLIRVPFFEKNLFFQNLLFREDEAKLRTQTFVYVHTDLLTDNSSSFTGSHFLRYYSTPRRSVDGGSPYPDVGGVMVAAVRPRLENHRPEKMAPSFNLLPRLARVMGSVLPQLGRQHFSSIHYFNCPIFNDLFPQFPTIFRYGSGNLSG